MKKSLVTVAFLSALVVGFSGCDALTDEETTYPTYSSGSTGAKVLSITQGSHADTINIVWNRSGKALKGSYTQLEISNSMGTDIIATTNSSGMIIIQCEKQSSGSGYVDYTCNPSNVTYSIGMKLTDSDINNVQERAGSNSSNSTYKVAGMSLNSDASYTVTYSY